MMGRKQSYIKMNETDVAYIAGLFDGEGSVYYKKDLDFYQNLKPRHCLTH